MLRLENFLTGIFSNKFSLFVCLFVCFCFVCFFFFFFFFLG